MCCWHTAAAPLEPVAADVQASLPAGVPPSATTILPTSGTTDPVILASITQAAAVTAAAAPLTPATILPIGPAVAAAAAAAGDDSNSTTAVVERVGTPLRFTRTQYARAVAAIRTGTRVQSESGGAVTMNTPALNSAILSAHNTYRATHGSPAMSWDNNAASAAWAWASRCIFQNEPVSPYGANMYMTSVRDVATALNAATKVW